MLVFTKNTKNTQVFWNNEKKTFTTQGFKFEKKIMNDVSLLFKLSNSFKEKTDSSKHVISVIKDAFPSIQVEQKTDSLSSSIKYFTFILNL